MNIRGRLLRARRHHGFSERPSEGKGSFNWGSTLWHEFAHVVTLQLTDHRVPRWFTEGLSVMEEHHAKPGWGDDLNLEVVKAIQDKKLLPIAELNSGFLRPQFPGQVQLSYFQAGQACEFIQSAFGFQSILKMLKLFKSQQPLTAVLHDTLGLTPESFDQRFNAYLETRFGRVVEAVDFALLDKKDLLKDPEKLAALVKAQPDNFFANLKLASYYRNEGDDDRSVEYFEKAKSLFPAYVAPRRNVIDAHHIHPDVAHEREIPPRLLRRADEIAVRIRLERPVGHALQKPLRLSLEEELRAHANRQKFFGRRDRF